MSTESSSSSSSTTSSSCPTPAPDASAGSNQAGGAGSSGASAGAEKRFEYLLQQTELFSHFMGDGKKAKSPLKIKPGKGKSEQTRYVSGLLITAWSNPQ